MNMQNIKDFNVKDFLPPTEPPADPPKEPPRPEPELKKRTILLTNSAPIRIVEEHWPEIAKGCSYDVGISEYGECGESVVFTVRRHADVGKPMIFNRCARYYRVSYIIHAKFWYDDPGLDPAEHSDPCVSVGRTLTGEAAATGLWKHMCEVADELRARLATHHHKRVTLALDAAFAGLEPQDIS